MNFDLTETQELFKATAERFAASINVVERQKTRSHSGGYDRKRWEQLAELGLLAIAAEEQHGGLGGSLTDLSIIAETLGLNNSVDPWLEIGILPLRLLSKAAELEYVEPLIAGSKIASLAFSEPEQQYQLQPKNTTAILKNDSKSYIINGVKQFVMSAGLADLLLVTADIGGEFAVFCVPSDSPGIEIRQYRIADGSHAGEVTLDQVQIATSARMSLTFEDLTMRFVKFVFWQVQKCLVWQAHCSTRRLSMLRRGSNLAFQLDPFKLFSMGWWTAIVSLSKCALFYIGL